MVHRRPWKFYTPAQPEPRWIEVPFTRRRFDAATSAVLCCASLKFEVAFVIDRLKQMTQCGEQWHFGHEHAADYGISLSVPMITLGTFHASSIYVSGVYLTDEKIVLIVVSYFYSAVNDGFVLLNGKISQASNFLKQFVI